MNKFINYNLDVFVIYVLINFFLLFRINGENLQSLTYIQAHPYSFLLILANTLLVSSIYLLNKLSDRQEDIVNNTNPKGSTTFIFYYYVCASMLAFLIYFSISKDLVPFFLLFFSLGLLYSYPRNYRLKKFFILKNLIPSFCWYLSLCLLLFFNLKDYFSFYQIFVQQIAIFASFFIFEILWDMPDTVGDRQAKVQTLPVVLGFDFTKFLLMIINLLIVVLVANTIYKIIALIIFLFLINVNKETGKKYYHLVILFISIVYIISGYYLLGNFKSSNNIVEKYYAISASQKKNLSKIEQTPEEEKALTTCGNDGKCFEKVFDKIAQREGGEVAFNKLFSFLGDHPDYNLVCHFAAHGIGHGSLKKNGYSFSKALQEFDGTKYFGHGGICGSGYYHGMIEYLASGLKTEQQILNKLSTLCNDAKVQKIIGQDCEHGIGHAAFLQLNFDLKKSIDVCSKLKIEEKLKYHCYSGVFMEASQDLPDDMVVSVENGKLKLPLCEELKDDFQKDACYFGSVYPLRNFVGKEGNNANYTEAIKYCQQIADSYNRIACIRRLARDAVGERYPKIREMCIDATKTKDERVACVANVANLVAIGIARTKNENYYKIVADICNYLQGDDKKQCVYDLQEATLKNYLPEDDLNR